MATNISHLDVTGLPCPEPVLRVKALLEGGHRGPLTVGLNNQASAVNVAAFLQAKGLKTQTYQEGDQWLVLAHEAEAPEILVWRGPDGWQAAMEEPAVPAAKGAEEPIIDLVQPVSPSPAPRTPNPAGPKAAAPQDGREEVAVLAGSQFMGCGDEALGAKLAQSFFDTLAAIGQPPRVIAFYNSGVLLTTSESAIVEALRDLEGQGSVVISCGICLEAYGLKDRLKVGRIGNMYEIINAQRHVGRVIRL